MTTIACSSCGQQLTVGFKFCPHCGTKQAPAEDVSAPPAAATAEPVVDDERDGADVEAATPFKVVAGLKPLPMEAIRRRDERRHVAVLFADVSGFTKMSDRLDAEQVHEVMNEVFTGLGKAITDEGGHIDKYIGDNVMALFGAPVAHEDDPVRACRAAVNMQAFLRDYAQRTLSRVGVELKMRIGINHGPVVAGGVGSDVKRQYTVMGDTVNVASRLESSAEPGAVLVSESIYQQARRHFEFGPVQHLTVKGKPRPIASRRCLRERPRVELGESSAARAPLIGRAAERRRLLDWLRRDDPRQRWLDVRGEMGVGKTRLVQEAVVKDADRQLLLVAPIAATTRRPFGLVRRIIHEAMIVETGSADCLASAESFSDAIQALDTTLTPYEQALWYVAAPSLAAVEAPDPDPQSMRRTVEQGVVAFLAAVAKSLPNTVLFIDRYELSDEASVELLHKAAESGEGLPMPVVTASRDDAPRPNVADACVVELGPLGGDDAAELLDELTRGAELPGDVRDDVLHRAAGVPLFLEEIVSSLIDAGQLRQDGGDTWTFDLAAEIVPLPPSLQAAMVSRLDRLPDEAHDLLCQCSVQGSDFDVQVAEWVRRDPPWQGPPPPPMLTRLGRMGIVGRVQPEDERRWAFVRPVMQEACYETLLMRDRRELHARTADALCALAGSRSRVSATLLAEHEERAERWMRAAEAHLAAGRDAAELFLNDQALRHFARVLELVDRAAAEGRAIRDAGRLKAAAHGGAAGIYLLIGNYDKAREQAQRMLARSDDQADQAEGKRLLAAVHARTGRIEEAVGLLQSVVALASSERCHEITAISHAWHDLAHLHYRANRLDEATACVAACRTTVCDDPRENQIRADLLEGVILHTRGRFDDSAALYRRAHAAAQDAGSLSQQARAINSLGNIERDRGDYATARVHFESALAIWRKMGDAECIAGAHNNLGNVALSIGDFDAAAHHHAQSSKQWQRIGNIRGAAMGQANLALLALERDDGHGAITAATEAMRLLHNTADRVLRDLVTVVLGEGMTRCGALEPAEALFDQVLESCNEAEHPLACAGAWRGKGLVRIERGDHGDAVPWLNKAADAYRALKRAQEEGRTHLLMANALAATGDREQAIDLVKRAAEQLEAIGAHRDGERARKMVAELER